MKIANIITAAASTVLLAAGIALAATPAHAAANGPLITERYDISWEGNGNVLTSCSASGDVVEFISVTQTGCWNDFWDYQIETGSYYYMHPSGYDSLCMTASTTDYGVIKIESCVGASQQFWLNPHNSAGYYQLENDYWGTYLDDPFETKNADATLGSDLGYGLNGQTFEQGA
jgi:hypothetical protein